MEQTKASVDKKQNKVFSRGFLRKGSGPGGGHCSVDGLRSENSTESKLELFKDRCSSAVLIPPPEISDFSATEARESQQTSGSRTFFPSAASGSGGSLRGLDSSRGGVSLSVGEPAGCSTASGGASISLSGFGWPGDIIAGAGGSITSSTSGGPIQGVVGIANNMFGVGGPGCVIADAAGSFTGPAGRIWTRVGETSPVAASSLSSSLEVGSAAVPFSSRIPGESSSAVVQPARTNSVVVPACVSDPGTTTTELANFFRDVTYRSDAAGGVASGSYVASGQPEVMVDKFQRVLQDRRMNQLRLAEVEARLSQLKQENVGLTMENYKLRAEAVVSHSSAVPRTVPESALITGVASAGSAASSWTVRGYSSRASTPVPVVPRAMSASSCARPSEMVVRTVGSSTSRLGASPLQVPMVVSRAASRARSESPGPRAAWASTLIPNRGSRLPPSPTKAAASPLVSPRVKGALRVPSTLRQQTPTQDRDYGRVQHITYSPSSGSYVAPAGIVSTVTTPLGSAVARSPPRNGASIVASPAVPVASPETRLPSPRIVIENVPGTSVLR